MPLSFCRRCSLLRYACRVLCVPGAFSRDVIYSYYHFYFYSHQCLPLPVFGRIFHALQQLGLVLRDISSVPLHIRYRIFSPPVYRSLHTFNKDSIAPLHWRSLYSSLVSQYPSYTEVFHDGLTVPFRIYSLRLCSVVRFLLTAGEASYWHLHLHCRNRAIFCAATYVSILHGNFPILTDSFSSVTALSSHHPRSHYLVSKTSSLLSGFLPSKVRVQWVPSHVGIPGNELVDDMAKGALRPSYTTQIPLSADDLRPCINAYYNT